MTAVNAEQRRGLFEQCRPEVLAHCVTDRAPALAACLDVTEVNRIVAHVVPHLLENARRRRTA